MPSQYTGTAALGLLHYSGENSVQLAKFIYYLLQTSTKDWCSKNRIKQPWSTQIRTCHRSNLLFFLSFSFPYNPLYYYGTILTASVFNRHSLLQIAVDSIVIELSYYFRYFCRNIQSQIDFYRMAPLPVRFFDKLG